MAPGVLPEGIDRTNTFSLRSSPSILILSASKEPPDNGDVGSRASTATRSPEDAHFLTICPIRVDFPDPGGPVTPRIHPVAVLIIGESPDSEIAEMSIDRLLRSPNFADSNRSLMSVIPIPPRIVSDSNWISILFSNQSLIQEIQNIRSGSSGPEDCSDARSK